ncbi:Ger(x)C family spore germination protein [Geobacillus sp. 46C-IIa]|uniref:Ger(x)C family spore germination protein n=1 Tax=Geobacillus sp. 46C-IIa TaxID=1963025 RepID=UPI001CC20397|nr:Ger(x)C family spore germination protein [Geobacillus sp. 46C-IIa]
MIEKKVKRALILLLVIVTIAMLGGCWDREEVNDIAVVLGIGIDRVKNEKIRLTVEIAVPRAISAGQTGGGGGGGSQGETIVRSGTGVTIADAIAQLQERLPRRLFWGHTKVVIFGEKAAKAGIREHLDFLIRHPQTRIRSNVLVSKGSAKSVLELLPPIEQSSSEVLREMAESRTLLRKTVKETLQMLKGEAETALLPMVKVLPPEKGKKEIETIAFIYGTAIFKKDRMVGQIDDYTTRGVLWIRNEIKQAHVTVKIPGEKGNITSRMIRSHTDVTPKYEKGRWKIVVNVMTEDDIILNGTKLNLLSERNIERIETELEKDINRRMKRALNRLQKEMEADVFGFAEAIHKKHPRHWRHLKKRWNDLFPEVPVELNTTVRVRRPGMNFPPQGVPEQEVKQ